MINVETYTKENEAWAPENLSGEYKKNPVEVGSKKIDFVLAPARSEAR